MRFVLRKTTKSKNENKKGKKTKQIGESFYMVLDEKDCK
jgi:hypothetical protein